MSDSKCTDTDRLEPNLQYIADAVRTLASRSENDSLALLALLRMLEGLHQEIRDNLFQASLPDNRRALYSLLKDIEASGGWPYIHRMKLRSLLVNFQDTTTDTDRSARLFNLTPPTVDDAID